MKITNTIHALIVGIDDFKYQNPLQACVNDAKSMADYLTKQANEYQEVKVHHLFNESATKSGIVAAFYSHLIEKAEEGDTAIFYFSGHGGQENAPETFRKYEADKFLEGIVCHDTGRGEGERLLADKELRYLLYQLGQKKCTIVTIFDCCHSGDITREEMDMPIRRLTGSSDVRKWEEFIFSKDPLLTDPNVFQEKTLDELIPPTNHIQFAACKDSELAYEHPTKHYGIFTHHLLQELEKTGGNISYFALQQRLQHQMKLKKYKQNPYVFAPRAYHSEIFKAFLDGLGSNGGKLNSQSPLQGQLGYDQYKKRWLLNLGGIHGLIANADDPQMVSIEGESERPITAFIKKVETASSELELGDDHGLNKRNHYQAYTSSFNVGPDFYLPQRRFGGFGSCSYLCKKQ